MTSRTPSCSYGVASRSGWSFMGGRAAARGGEAAPWVVARVERGARGARLAGAAAAAGGGGGG